MMPGTLYSLGSAGAPPLVARIVGTELVRGRHDYTVYKLQLAPDEATLLLLQQQPPPPQQQQQQLLYRRYSQFVELVTKLCSRSSALAAKPGAAELLEEWRWRLQAEKRHAGGLALTPAVVGHAM